MFFDLIVDTWYVCIPVVFALAVLDPLLTALSYRRYRETLAKRVDMEQFELNPRWQKAVEAGRILPLRYVLRVGVSLAVLAVLFAVPEQIFGPDASPRAALVGYLLCTYLIIDLNHLSNLRSFRLRRTEPEPDADKPKVKLGYSYSLGLTQLSYETTFLMLLALWLVAGGYFLFGAAAAPLVIAYRLRFIRANALRKERGMPLRNYRKLRLAILLLVIAAILTFVHFHRTIGYYQLHVERGKAFMDEFKYSDAISEYELALDYVHGGQEAKDGIYRARKICYEYLAPGFDYDNAGKILEALDTDLFNEKPSFLEYIRRALKWLSGEQSQS